MRNLSIFITLLLILTSCNCQKKRLQTENLSQSQINHTKAPKNSISEIKYQSAARNFGLFFKIENKVMSIGRDKTFVGFTETINISDKDWKFIQAKLKKLDLQKVTSLEGPTNLRFHDGAAYANISFFSNGVEYSTKGFDHEHPPVAIDNLVNKLVDLAKVKQ